MKLKKPSIIIDVEDVELASTLVAETNTIDLVKKYGNNVLESSNLPERLIDYGGHSFIGGMYQAYSEHRPYTVSPEMIWMLIQQGISTYLHHNVEEVKSLYPSLVENTELSVECHIDEENIVNWQEGVSSTIKGIADKLGNEFTESYRCNFSHSSDDEKIAGDLMIMDGMQPFFQYIFFVAICGIPRVTVEGSPEDWKKILLKLRYFERLNLNWWFKKIAPLISKIKKAAEGEKDTDFWLKMFKIHTKEDYGNPKVIDGWVTSFYPYDVKGKVILGAELRGLSIDDIFETLPKELRNIPFVLRVNNEMGSILKEIPMEFSAGFIGVSQDPKSMTLRPEIGWFVGRETDKGPGDYPYEDEMPKSLEYYSLDAFPTELLRGESYGDIVLNYKNEINYPDKIVELKAEALMLNGSLTDNTVADLRKKFVGKEVFVAVNHDWDGIFAE